MQLSERAELHCAVLYGCDFSWGLMAVLFFVCSGSYGGLRARRGPGFRGDAAGLVCGGAGHGDRHRSAATGGGAGAQSHVRQPAGQGKRLYSFQKCIKSLSFLPLTYTPQSFAFQGWTYPEPQSEREDLVYYEHKPLPKPRPGAESQEERSSDKSLIRRPSNPLDIAVTRLAELERHIERRYLRSPLGTTIQIKLDNVGTVTVPAPAPSTSAGGEG